MKMNWKICNNNEMNSKWVDWDHLNGLYYNHHPYFDSRFIKPLMDCFSDKAVKLVELKDNGGIIHGMLLLYKRLPGLWTLFNPSQLQIAPVLVSSKLTSQYLKTLVSSIPGYCWMLEMLYQDPLNTPISDQIKLPYCRREHCTTTNVKFDTDFEDYWKKRPKKFKQNIRTAFNRLKKDDIQCNFLVRKSLDEVITGVRDYGLLESKSWKGDAGTAIHPDNIQGTFYSDVLSGFAKDGNASVYELYFNDELAGSILSISNDRMSILLKTSFNKNFQDYSPGRLVQYKFLEHEFNQKKFKVMEAYTNANKDQLDWSTEQRNIFHFEIYRNLLVKKILRIKKGSKE
jgi:hypothetical protein